MNLNLSYLHRTIGDAEATIETIMIVQAVSNNTATREERDKFHRMGESTVRVSMRIIRDFTSVSGVFNIDHIAWQLGVDITAEGPSIPDDHICLEEYMIYDGHVAAPGMGIAMHCKVCTKHYIKIGNTFYPADEGAHIMIPEQVR